jgi:hypothetical protein
VLDDEDWPGRERGVLVEKMLDITSHAWCKWNDNAGGIDGRAAHLPIDVDAEFAKLTQKPIKVLDSIDKEESGEEDEDSCSESEDEETRASLKAGDGLVKPADYLQAFTHFSYRFTNRKVMVCDLQGIYDDTVAPPRFELTDPAIHYRSKQGRTMVYGRTDKGEAGMKLFFKTHKCTEICKLMQLSRKNKNWRKDWHQSHGDNPPPAPA